MSLSAIELSGQSNTLDEANVPTMKDCQAVPAVVALLIDPSSKCAPHLDVSASGDEGVDCTGRNVLTPSDWLISLGLGGSNIVNTPSLHSDFKEATCTLRALPSLSSLSALDDNRSIFYIW
jgi:hypothetical protein